MARVVGSQRPLTAQRWRLDDVADMAKQEPEGEHEPEEDELLVQARRMVQRAREYDELSLAERVLRDRARRMITLEDSAKGSAQP